VCLVLLNTPTAIINTNLHYIALSLFPCVLIDLLYPFLSVVWLVLVYFRSPLHRNTFIPYCSSHWPSLPVRCAVLSLDVIRNAPSHQI
jgi:hypothetical protein